MSAETLRRHGRTLADFASEAEARSSANPEDWFLAIAAANQRANAETAIRAAELADSRERGELLEWRFQGNRLKHGALPLDFLSKLAGPLNSLLVRAAYFARNRVDAMYGAADELTREISLSLVDVAPGSTRLFIRGNTAEDLTGSSAFAEGVDGLFGVLTSGADFKEFYDHLDDIGERAAEALHETLKAVESEECSLEVKWHSPGRERLFEATFDRVVQMRALLGSLGEVRERAEHLSGRVTLLAATGRLQLQLDDGQKVTVRFRPRSQSALVAPLTLNSLVELDAIAKVNIDPITGEEVKRYSLTSMATPLWADSPTRE